MDSLAHIDVEKLSTLISQLTLPVIATCRSVAQGGQSQRSSDVMSDILSQLPAKYFDEEFDANQVNTPQGCSTLGPLDNCVKLLSFHDFERMPEDIPALLARMEQDPRGSSVVKIAWRCSDICDNVMALSLSREEPGKRVLICMGEKGLMSRVLASKADAFGTFCAANSTRLAAPGQVSLRAMLDLYRWRSIDQRTKFFGVIGSPVGHSLSPALFNAQFAADKINGVYLPLLIDDSAELGRFLQTCLDTPWLDATGFSVTIPHKESVFGWLGNRIDEQARRVGAVNTLHLQDGQFNGYNTDYASILGALIGRGGISLEQIESLDVAVLGAGGVARAAVAALTASGANVTIYNRTQARARALAENFDCAFGPWEARTNGAPDLVINCTSIGMWPNAQTSPFPAECLDPKTVVFDTVYRPLETCLISEAKAVGCPVIEGLEMFIHQAAAQYEIWTGRPPNFELLRRVALAGLDANETDDRKTRR